MIAKEYKVLGHVVKYNVPATSEEFNKLDTKRPDAACDEAVANIVYRTLNADTRYFFLHGRKAEEAKDGKPAVTAIVGVEDQLEEMFKDVEYDDKDKERGLTILRGTKPVLDKENKPRVKDGVPVEEFTESEDVYYKRALSMAVKYKKFGSEDLARAHFQPLIEGIAAEMPFDPTQATPSGRGPVRLPVRFKVAAAKSITIGTVAKVNSEYLSKIGKSFTPTNDTTKMYTGKYPAGKNADGSDILVDFNVSDKDAETYGWMIKEYQDWKAAQELTVLSE